MPFIAFVMGKKKEKKQERKWQEKHEKKCMKEKKIIFKQKKLMTKWEWQHSECWKTRNEEGGEREWVSEWAKEKKRRQLKTNRCYIDKLIYSKTKHLLGYENVNVQNT